MAGGSKKVRELWLRIPQKVRTGLVVLTNGIAILLSPFLAYLAVAWTLASITVNHDQVEPESGVEILIDCRGVHTDYWVPRNHRLMSWTPWFRPQDFEKYYGGDYVRVGWGDREVFTKVPEWKDLNAGIAFRAALLPTASLTHVAIGWKPEPTNNITRVVISEEDYGHLIDHIKSGFRLNEKGKPILVPGESYYGWDAFYEGQGSYELVTTCNEWAGRGLRAAGIRTGAWTPFVSQIQRQLDQLRKSRIDAPRAAP